MCDDPRARKTRAQSNEKSIDRHIGVRQDITGKDFCTAGVHCWIAEAQFVRSDMQ